MAFSKDSQSSESSSLIDLINFKKAFQAAQGFLTNFLTLQIKMDKAEVEPKGEEKF